ncbi:MAG: hypothetical protein AB7F22_28580 [Reyranella sp.]|uniref:hypothetical protein n=1 Tax=Reyranella sp. TaxID=1929291 RepID=UPI003D0B0D57
MLLIGVNRSPYTRRSGGAGPMVFEVGKHKEQLAVIAAKGAPVAAYTFFTRDPAPIGKHLWDLSWGETMLWLPLPSFRR